MSIAVMPDKLPARVAGGEAEPQRASLSRLSFRANFSWAVAGNAVYAACQWGVLAVLARLASAEALGEYAFAVAMAAPIMIFSMLHLRALQATDARGEYAFGDFLALRLTTTVTSIAVIVCVAMFAPHSGAACALMVVAGLIASADAMSDVFAGALQRRERLDYVAFAMFAKGLLGLLAVAVAVSAGGGVMGAAAALAATRWSVLFIYELPVTVRLLRKENRFAWQPRWQWKRLAKLAVTALPLGLVMLLMSLQANVPRYFLQHYSGSESLGIFVGLVALTQLGSLVINAMGQAASPRLANAYQAGRRGEFVQLVLVLVAAAGTLGAMGVVLVALAGERILAFVYGAQYAAHVPAFSVLMLASAVLYASGPLGYAATAARRIRLQPVVHVINICVTVVIGWLAAPAGVFGMSLAVLASALTSALLFVAILVAPEHVGPERTRMGFAHRGASRS